MKILLPHKTKSLAVKKWSEIRDDVYEMRKMVISKDFIGRYKEALAISHAQVSETPKAFFVIHDSLKDSLDGFDVFCNAKIIKANEPIVFKEACLSYPFRGIIKTRRSDHIIFEADVHNPLKFLGSQLSRRQFKVYGLVAFIVQHEIDHARGINIFDRF